MPRPYGFGGVPLVRRYVRKRTFSTADRVLVHLSADGLKPEERTQEGVAAATVSGRSTLTKWLRRLERRGLVTRDRVRMPEHPLPKYAYRLSPEGWREASAVRERLDAHVVTIRAPNLADLPVRVSDIPTLAPAQLGLAAAVASVRRGLLDLGRVAAASRPRAPVVWGDALRRVDRFYGRTKELQDLDAWWASRSRVLLVTGLAGIGKSALVAAWVQGRQMSVPVYGFDCRPSSTSAGVLSDFGAFLAALGKPSLSTQVSQGVPLDLAFASRLIGRDLLETPILLILDNADRAPRDVARLLLNLFVHDGGPVTGKVILLGRRPPRWLGDDEVRVETRSLQGLDPSAAKALLASRGLRADSAPFEDMLRKARGHPLLLHLSASHGTSRAREVQRYLRDEVWGSLTAEERSVLRVASVLRRPATERFLAAVAGARPRVLESLADRYLLERTVGGRFATHDLIREFVVSRLSTPHKRSIHARCANLLLESTESRERWEGVYHLLEADRVDQAAELLVSEGSKLLDCVAAEEIASLVHGLTIDETQSRTYCVFAEVLGDSLRIRGHLGPALFQYDHSRQLAENSRQTQQIPRLLRKMAFLERCRNQYAKALGHLVEAQARLVRLDDPSERTEVLRELALVDQATGNSSDASAHLAEAVDLATEMSDRGPLSRALLALGSFEIDRGRPEEGLDYTFEGLRVAERAGNLTEVAHAHIVVGTALQGLGRLAESLQHHETGLEVARLLGNFRLTAYATLNRAGVLISLGRLPEASVALTDAHGYLMTLEERGALAILRTYEAQLHVGLGHWARARMAWEEALAELRTAGSPLELALGLKECGAFYADRGDANAGRECLLEARTIAGTLGNAKLAEELERALSVLGPSHVPGSRT